MESVNKKNIFKIALCTAKPVQVNICQKQLFLHQLTHNMTTDYSWNYHEHVLLMF